MYRENGLLFEGAFGGRSHANFLRARVKNIAGALFRAGISG